jgi:signal transduction histidine kinase/DNA-binding NarL/FixJ family response regulator
MPTRAPTPSAVPGDQVSSLNGAVQDLAGQFALPALLERILRRAVGLLHGAAGSICTVDEPSGTYRKEVDLGVGCRQGQVFPLGEGTTGAVVTRRGPVVFDRYCDVPGGHVAAEERDRLMATVGVPIEWAGAIIGVCVIFSTDPARRWHQHDVDLLRIFAGHAAVAIANARLHAEAAERARRLAVGAERERVVRDVHDALVRTLGAVVGHLDAVTSTLAPTGEQRAHLEAARAEALTALSETRRTVLGLGPALLEGRHLHDAVDQELAWVRSTTTLRTDLVVTGDPGVIDREAAAPILHAVQEALTNVVAHAGATQVRVGVMYGVDRVTALVSDDGRGFDAAGTVRAGLDRTVARVEQLGGTVHIEAWPEWGTRVRVELPTAPGPAVNAPAAPSVRVLVADPRPLVRAGVVRLLARAEPDIVAVAEAGDTDALRAAVLSADPDVVVLGVAGRSSMLAGLARVAPATAAVLLVDRNSAHDLRISAEHGGYASVDIDTDATELARVVRAAARDVAVAAARRSEASPRLDLAGLTGREQQVGDLVVRGLADKQIAIRLGISAKTVEKHVGSLLRKTGSANRTTLAGRLVHAG